jgi:hypothetical protein
LTQLHTTNTKSMVSVEFAIVRGKQYNRDHDIR